MQKSAKCKLGPTYPIPTPNIGFLIKQTNASSYKLLLPLVVNDKSEICSNAFKINSFFINTNIDIKIASTHIEISNCERFAPFVNE